jgi:hypothetical protein
MTDNYLINRLDSMDKSNNERFERVYEAIAHLQAIVTNGLSDRSRESLERIQALENTAATKEDIQALKQERDNADAAWKEARRWRVRTLITIVIAVGTTAASLIFGG